MATTKRKPTLEALLEREDWEAARERIEAEMVRKPDDHWLLTQLAVTYYEQRRYRDALGPLLKSLEIMPDCPLTLWHLAGTYDALGDYAAALEIYTRLLRSKTTPAADPCWESKEWANALKADCVFRIGSVLGKLGVRDSAEHCYRQYIGLALAGAGGTYSVEEAARRIGALGERKSDRAKAMRAAFASVLGAEGAGTMPASRRQPAESKVLFEVRPITPSAPKRRRAARPSAPLSRA